MGSLGGDWTGMGDTMEDQAALARLRSRAFRGVETRWPFLMSWRRGLELHAHTVPA